MFNDKMMEMEKSERIKQASFLLMKCKNQIIISLIFS